jgi:hypothetical protein
MLTTKKWQPHRPPARRVEVLITILGLLGLALGLAFFDQAFPSAAIDLKLSRDEIAQRAHTHLQAQGFGADDYEFVLDFDADRWASFYLERVLGVAETNRRVRAENLPIWYWHARWFKPLQKEEFGVDLLPDGTVRSFSHTVLETAPGAKMPQDQARTIAENFLTQKRHWNLAEWERVTASSEDRPGGRADHHFEWKRRDFSAGDAELRLTVDIQGDRIGTYHYSLDSLIFPSDF